MEQEASMKKNVFDLKKTLSSEKQEVAIEMAQIEVDVIKKKDRLELQSK